MKLKSIRHRKKHPGGRPPGVAMPCGWGCGSQLLASQIRTHFTRCPNRPKMNGIGAEETKKDEEASMSKAGTSKKNPPPRARSPLDWCHICNRFSPCYHTELTEAQKRNDKAGLPYIEAHVNAASQANAFHYAEIASSIGDRWAVDYWKEQARERRKEAQKASKKVRRPVQPRPNRAKKRDQHA